MQQQFKICAGCGPGKLIYKNIAGKSYCRRCTLILEPPKAISRRSKKRAAQERVYSVQSKALKLEVGECVAKLPGCTGWNVETLTIQHCKGRIGDLLLDQSEQIVICWHCHEIVNHEPLLAKELGLEKSRLSIN